MVGFGLKPWRVLSILQIVMEYFSSEVNLYQSFLSLQKILNKMSSYSIPVICVLKPWLITPSSQLVIKSKIKCLLIFQRDNGNALYVNGIMASMFRFINKGKKGKVVVEGNPREKEAEGMGTWRTAKLCRQSVGTYSMCESSAETWGSRQSLVFVQLGRSVEGTGHCSENQFGELVAAALD